MQPLVVSELSPEVEAAFADVRDVAMDVEGVDLSRKGGCSYLFNTFPTMPDPLNV
jgi:hypothetical protein